MKTLFLAKGCTNTHHEKESRLVNTYRPAAAERHAQLSFPDCCMTAASGLILLYTKEKSLRLLSQHATQASVLFLCLFSPFTPYLTSIHALILHPLLYCSHSDAAIFRVTHGKWAACPMSFCDWCDSGCLYSSFLNITDDVVRAQLKAVSGAWSCVRIVSWESYFFKQSMKSCLALALYKEGKSTIDLIRSKWDS